MAPALPVKSPWFPYVRRSSQPRLRLFCFPFAGGGASAYRAWFKAVPDSVEVWPVQLPGRETRWGEAPFTDLNVLLPRLAEIIHSASELPFVFFGHSMGALISFELARLLHTSGAPVPRHLFASGRTAPHLPRRGPSTTEMTDARFVEELGRLNGTPRAVLENPELLALVLPVLRSDFRLYESYQPRAEDAPLPLPITAFGGVKDEDVLREDLEGWAQHTEDFRGVRMFPGDHFFLQSAQDDLLQTLFRELRGEL